MLPSVPAFINLPGPTEWIVILIIVLVIFGPKKLPEISKAIGQSIREFKKPQDEAVEEKTEKKDEA